MLALLDAAEALAEREVAHHVEAKPVAPVLHVFWFGPSSVIHIRSQDVDPGLDILEDEIFVTFDRRV